MLINFTAKGPVPHFTWEEIANNKAKETVKLAIADWRGFLDHAEMIEELRQWAVFTYPKMFKNGLIVSSWFRYPAFNKSVGGASNSAHLDARATDINNIPQALYDEFITAWQTICASYSKIGGIELYKEFMHFDSHSDKFGCTEFRLKDNR